MQSNGHKEQQWRGRGKHERGEVRKGYNHHLQVSVPQEPSTIWKSPNTLQNVSHLCVTVCNCVCLLNTFSFFIIPFNGWKNMTGMTHSSCNIFIQSESRFISLKLLSLWLTEVCCCCSAGFISQSIMQPVFCLEWVFSTMLVRLLKDRLVSTCSF